MHTRRRVSIGAACGGAVLLWVAVMTIATGPVVHGQEGGGRKVWDGVYTDAQAARGKPAFETSCGRCHNNALVGSERAPALKGDGFFSRWENDTLDKLFTKIRDTMPADGRDRRRDRCGQAGHPRVHPVRERRSRRSRRVEHRPARARIDHDRQAGRRARGCVELQPRSGRGLPGSRQRQRLEAHERERTRRHGGGTSTAAALAKAGAQPLGRLDVELVSVIGAYQAGIAEPVRRSKPGADFRSSSDNVLNLTSLQPLGASCP